MIEEELGSPIDIHGGGIDLIFPHHENEIAQSESAHGHALARVWMHNGFLTMDATKMSKSLGNIITPRELLEQGWQGETLRWALLSAHYRAPLDWTEDLLRQAQASLDRLYGALLRLKDVDASAGRSAHARSSTRSPTTSTRPPRSPNSPRSRTAANIAKKPAEQAQAKGELARRRRSCSACCKPIPNTGSAPASASKRPRSMRSSPNASPRARARTTPKPTVCATNSPHAASK